MYVDAKQIKGRIHVSSYDENGQHQITTHLPPYVFYHDDPNGKFKSIYGDKLSINRSTSYRKFKQELGKFENRSTGDLEGVFESDIRPVFRHLEERYPGKETPPLKVSFFDIEVDKDPQRGWAGIDNPYAIINAITVYNKWIDEYVTIAVAPPTLSRDEAKDLLGSDTKKDAFGVMNEDNGYWIAYSEEDLLMSFLDLIEEADVLTGWNSSFYDLPYIIQRIRIVLGGESLEKVVKEDGSDAHPFSPSYKSHQILMRLNMFECLPRMRMVEKWGKMEKVFDIFGRVHLDYLELFSKFTFEELHSFTLDNVLRVVVNQSKIPYEGSLDELYRNDFRTFIAYNRQDVAGMTALDNKLKMIQLANAMVHMAGVTFDKVFGSVSIIEQAVLKELHKQGKICFNFNYKESEGSVPGAYVLAPKKGLYEWVCSFDINSLYPSVIRAINISPETLIGQFLTTRTMAEVDKFIDAGMKPSAAWGSFTGVYEYHDIINETDDPITFKIEDKDDDGEEITLTAKEWKKVLKDNKWSISANGSVFDMTKEGIVPHCMTKWYNDRVESQKKAGEYEDLAKMTEEPDKKKEYEDLSTYYDMEQLVKKIFLNSTYGAYLNDAFRFYDPRLGKSVTLTSRVISKHMHRKSCEALTGNYDFDRNALIYGDTDSTYTTLKWYMEQNDIEVNAENAIRIADEIGVIVNESFPQFMVENCLVNKKQGGVIKAAREIVATRAMFKDAKKRYAAHVINNKGKPTDKMKFTGMEMKRSDTPKFMQEFLERIVTDVVKHGKGYDELRETVDEFRSNIFRNRQPWERGTPGRVSKLTLNAQKMKTYEAAKSEGYVGIKKPVPHYSVTASIGTNRLMEQHGENRWDFIRDGDKVEILYLKPNTLGVEKVAIKVGEHYVPDWFKELPFDNQKQEAKNFDRKVELCVGEVMDWDFSPITDYREEVFDYEDFFAGA